MADFTLDTSGCIHMPGVPLSSISPRFIWSDLSPFAQGYVEALLREANAALHAERAQQGRERSRFDRDLVFSDLAPESLALILRDCEDGADGARGGRLFWEMRRRDAFKGNPLFPPLTPYLGDDGKVYLRESAA